MYLCTSTNREAIATIYVNKIKDNVQIGLLVRKHEFTVQASKQTWKQDTVYMEIFSVVTVIFSAFLTSLSAAEFKTGRFQMS